jgi:hypothetical protein
MPRMSRVRRIPGVARLLALSSLVLLAGCSEDASSGFMEVEPQFSPITVFDDLIMRGGDQKVAYFDIATDMVHPEVRSNWTVLNREVFIDMYLFRATDYDPNLPPDVQDFFWSSVPAEGPLFGDRRGTQIILHPCVYDNESPPRCRPEGQWVVVFYNDNEDIFAKRTSLSATVNLRFFK